MSSPKKKELEIVYNLQWKHGPDNGDDKANIVGMQDIPATTLTWDAFQSYLLKNSGVSGDDVKVSYISSDNKEFCINGQLDFQLAMYSFRKRARNGEIITLKLDRISSHNKLEGSGMFHSFDNKNSLICLEQPPAWFESYMKQFKQEIKEEISASVLDAVSNAKISCCNQPTNFLMRKSKVESVKRPRKLIGLNLMEPEKEHVKTLDRKLDNKMEKFGPKLALKVHKKKPHMPNPYHHNGDTLNKMFSTHHSECIMDVHVVNQVVTITCVRGCKTYKQDWQVTNTGTSAWNSDTKLKFAWGSEVLKSSNLWMECPNLKPGEKGVVTADLQIPDAAGFYEGYWYFKHLGCRFGNWIGCKIVVSESRKIFPIPPIIPLDVVRAPIWPKKLKTETANDTLPYNVPIKTESIQHESIVDKNISNTLNVDNADNAATFEKDVADVSSSLEHLGLDQANEVIAVVTSSDSDNQSIVSIADSNSTDHSAGTDEFDLVLDFKVENEQDIKTEEEDLVKIDNPDRTDEILNTEGDTNNNTEDKVENDSEYAYINFYDKKIPVPKRLLREDYLAVAESAPNPEKSEQKINSEPLDYTKPKTSLDSTKTEADLRANESMSTSVNLDKVNYPSNSRLFVFPMKSPGFELVNPTTTSTHDHVTSSDVTSTTEKLMTMNQASYTQQQHLPWQPHYDFCPITQPVCPTCPPPSPPNTSSSTPQSFNLANGSSPNAATSTPDTLHKRFSTYMTTDARQFFPTEGSPRHSPHLHDTLVTSAVNVASSAINTARSVLNMFSQQPAAPAQRVNDSWEDIPSMITPRKQEALQMLEEMGFPSRQLNESILSRYHYNIELTLEELIRLQSE